MKNLKKVLRSLKNRGVKSTFRLILQRLYEKILLIIDYRFDRQFKVDTRGITEIADLDITESQKEGAIWYEPTPVTVIKSMLKLSSIDYSKYTFIDFGSGKGRVLLLASEYAFKRIIGVEFSARLDRIAKDNIKSWDNPKQKCHSLESICMDARDFKLPDGPLVLYFFTPFKESVTIAVANNIKESLKDMPRPVQIIFYGSSQNFINILMRFNFTCKKIFPSGFFAVLYRYKGFLFNPNR
jgi:SAM-dependent methyltransferase